MEDLLTDWDEEKIINTAKESGLTTITEFAKKYSGAYHAAERLGIKQKLRDVFEWKGGKKWTKLNDDRSLRQRAWYYTRIYADTKDDDVVYVLNVSYHKSKDGGKIFESSNAPHGDHHDLWISPSDPSRMIIADDGGAQVSYDGGDSWSTYHNQPTAQFYRLVTDNHFPFRIYVAQQDNSTLRISHRSVENSITEADWEETA
jgi:hypothetical protein